MQEFGLLIPFLSGILSEHGSRILSQRLRARLQRVARITHARITNVSMGDPRLGSLIDMYIAGVISADELAELHERLATSAAACEQYNWHIAGCEITHPDLVLPNAEDFLAQWDTAETISSEEVFQDESMEVIERTRIHTSDLFRASFRKWRQWSIAGTAAAFLVVVGIRIVHQRLAPLPLFHAPVVSSVGTVATLRHAADVRWVNITNETFIGDAFGAQRLQIAAGTIQLDFKRGARLVVEGPADLQLITDNEAFLHSGNVTAHVPDEAHGFKITAPALAVTDLGTEFGLRAATNDRAQLHVFSGVVEMQQLTFEARRMAQGQAAQIQGRRIRNISTDRNVFVFEDEVAERETKEQHTRYFNWRDAARSLSADPAALVHYTFEEQSIGSRQLANDAATASPATAGTVVGCQWTEGRWPEKHAVTFGGKSDRVRFAVPNTLTSLTYMAWLRIDNLVNLSNALAITESMQQGEVHWQVYRDGRVALSARSGNGSTVDQSWDRGLSPAIFTAKRLGKWTHLVSVYDSRARTINHYVNGEFISSTPIKRPLPLKLGAVEIGNWGVKVDASVKNANSAYWSRHWNGSVDEFALFSRAMTADEIRHYYERGRVATGALFARK